MRLHFSAIRRAKGNDGGISRWVDPCVSSIAACVGPWAFGLRHDPVAPGEGSPSSLHLRYLHRYSRMPFPLTDEKCPILNEALIKSFDSFRTRGKVLNWFTANRRKAVNRLNLFRASLSISRVDRGWGVGRSTKFQCRNSGQFGKIGSGPAGMASNHPALDPIDAGRFERGSG